MRLCIHRGAHQIGGSCVELEHDGYSILLDLGLPLDAENPSPFLLPDTLPLSRFLHDESRDAHPNLPTRALELAPVRAVVVSHIHPDHIGLTSFVPVGVPVYLGERAARLLRAAKDFLPRLTLPQNLVTYSERDSFSLGPFKITPFLVDHSAFDAYAFLVEARGRRVFYSGDLRAHGRKARLVEKLINNPPANIDVFLLEGTTLSRGDFRAETEAELEERLQAHLASAPGLVLATFSAQNVDRFVTFFKATLRAGRVFIGDAYLAHMLRALGLPSLPRPDTEKFRVYLPNAQRRPDLADRSFDLIRPFRHARIFADEIVENPSRFVLLFRESMAMGIPIMHCHTSGHADPATLRRLVNSFAPKLLVPIHTDRPDMFRQHFPKAVLVDDGEWLGLDQEAPV